MGDLADGESTKVKGSGSSVYTLKNVGGVYSCTCPAWAHQSLPIERRSCKHLRALRGADAEEARTGAAAGPVRSARAPRPATTADGEAATADADADTAPPLLLAHRWETEVDLTGWWMSEKLDGVRAYWDGRQFISRLGNRFFAPAWFTAGMPDFPLDGELWGGRKQFQRTVGVVKRQDESAAWRAISYVVFDAPSHGGLFEERLEHARAALGRAGLPHATLHEHVVCEGTAHLKAELARVEALGGEGLMMRQPRSRYEVGRSSTLLKVKTFHDAEARVVAHVAGAGRHKGRLGALVVELPDGTRFNVGTGFSDREREEPPELGALITFRYQELSEAGVPRFPSYVGVRIDAAWPTPAPAAAAAKPAKPKPPSAPRKPTAAPRPSTTTAAAGGELRHFEYVQGSSSKFWEIRLEGDRFTTRWGRIGTNGQTTLKTFSSHNEARREHDALVAEKLKKGYVERGS